MDRSVWLEEYLSKFPETQREMVFREIARNDVFRSVMASSNRVVLEDAVALLQGGLGRLVDLCCEGFDKNADKIRQTCMEVSTIHGIMLRWAQLLVDGKKHERG